MSCAGESQFQGAGRVPPTSSYCRELAALPGRELRGLQQVGVGPCSSQEGAGIWYAGGKHGTRVPAGTVPRTCTISKAYSYTQHKENGQLPLPDPSSAATTTFDLLLIPCQITLDVPKSHWNIKCHVFFLSHAYLLIIHLPAD